MDEIKFLEKIRRMYPKFSKSHKIIAENILENWENVAFISPSELGKKLGVSETTVIRFARNLGYNNYSELKEHIQELIKIKLTPAKKMKTTMNKIENYNNPLDELIRELNILEDGINRVSFKEIKEAIKKINSAKRVFIIGFGVSASLCKFLEFRFTRMKIDTHILIQGGKTFFDNLSLIEKDDIVIAIGFFRCDPEIIKAAKYIKELKATIISITSSQVSELARLSDIIIVANRGPKDEVKSLVVPMAILNFMTIMLAQNNNTEALEELDKVYNGYYEKERR